jgi:hypothetical protein
MIWTFIFRCTAYLWCRLIRRACRTEHLEYNSKLIGGLGLSDAILVINESFHADTGHHSISKAV